ncbi:MAG: hypothetical protein QM697_08250 [Lachnospiraceae bacterium]
MKVQEPDMRDQFKIVDTTLDIEALIRQTESQPLLSAPSYLKEEIIEKSLGISVQVPIQLKKQKKEISKRMQLLFYSLKISAAVVFCLFQLATLNRFPADMNICFYRAIDSYHDLQTEQESARDAVLSLKETTDIGLSERAGQSIRSLLNQLTNGGIDHD